MTRHDFEQYLAVYGSDLNRWPKSLRREAEHLLVEDESCRHLMAAENDFETILSGWQTPEKDKSLCVRITDAVAQLPQEQPPRMATGWQIAASIVLFAGGAYMGTFLNGPTMTDNTYLYEEGDGLWNE